MTVSYESPSASPSASHCSSPFLCPFHKTRNKCLPRSHVQSSSAPSGPRSPAETALAGLGVLLQPRASFSVPDAGCPARLAGTDHFCIKSVATSVLCKQVLCLHRRLPVNILSGAPLFIYSGFTGDSTRPCGFPFHPSPVRAHSLTASPKP